jgi:hypothetical protein
MASSKPRIIDEKTNLLHRFRNIHHIIEEQGWEEYLSSLKGPIYPQLCKRILEKCIYQEKEIPCHYQV